MVSFLANASVMVKLLAFIMLLPLVLSSLTACEDDSECQNAVCYVDTDIVNGEFCLCNSGFGGAACDETPELSCTPTAYDGPSFDSVAHAEWVAGDKVVISVVVPYQADVRSTRIHFNFENGETLCDYPAGFANDGVEWTVTSAQDDGGAECTQTYTTELTFAQVSGVEGALAASPNRECFTIPSVAVDGEVQTWTAFVTVWREYVATFNGNPVYPIASNEHRVQLVFPATADFTSDASITFANIEDAILIRQSFSSGKWRFLVDAYVPHPLEIVMPLSFDPATINGVAFSTVSVSECLGNPFCVQRLAFELVSTAAASETLTLTLPLACKNGFICDAVPTGEITLSVRLPDMSPTIDDVAPVTAIPSMHRNTYGGPVESFFIASETIYFELELVHPQNTLVSSASLASVRVGGAEVDLGDADIVTIPGLQGDQTFRFQLVVGTKAPWPVDSSNGNPSAVTIAGDLEYVLGDFSTKRVAFTVKRTTPSTHFSTRAMILSSTSDASAPVCALALLLSLAAIFVF